MASVREQYWDLWVNGTALSAIAESPPSRSSKAGARVLRYTAMKHVMETISKKCEEGVLEPRMAKVLVRRLEAEAVAEGDNPCPPPTEQEWALLRASPRSPRDVAFLRAKAKEQCQRTPEEAQTCRLWSSVFPAWMLLYASTGVRPGAWARRGGSAARSRPPVTAAAAAAATAGVGVVAPRPASAVAAVRPRPASASASASSFSSFFSSLSIADRPGRRQLAIGPSASANARAHAQAHAQARAQAQAQAQAQVRARIQALAQAQAQARAREMTDPEVQAQVWGRLKAQVWASEPEMLARSPDCLPPGYPRPRACPPLSSAGWKRWPRPEREEWGLVWVIPLACFGQYDDDDEGCCVYLRTEAGMDCCVFRRSELRKAPFEDE